MRLVTVVLLACAAGCASPRDQVVGGSPDGPPESLAAESTSTAACDDTSQAIASMLASRGDPVRSRASGADDEPEVRVTAPRESSGLREDRLVGSNEQPEWTTERRFATTRAYVIAPGQVEVEQWYKLQTPRGSAPNHFWQTEVGIGFEGRFQLDLYENYGHEPGGPTEHRGVQVEGRWAFADWGRIPLNPTIYLEYVQNHRAPDKVEAKLLLADDLCRGWHWAGNLVYEQETGGARETELAIAAGISHTILDSKFSVGAEAKAERVTGKGFRSQHDAENELLLGPSLQWRPTATTHLDFVPLFGLTKSDRRDPRLELYLVFGIDFGPERAGKSCPTSSRSK